MSRRLGSMRISKVFGCLLGTLVLIQLWQPVRDNPAGDAHETLTATLAPPENVQKALLRACYDCHSNETRWPWYAWISPVSLLVARDVARARAELNFSSFAKQARGDRSAALENVNEVVQNESMPLPPYLMLHPDARLTRAEKRAIELWTSAEREKLAASTE